MPKFKTLQAVVLAALLAAGCGGGSDAPSESGANPPLSVVVLGDSIASANDWTDLRRRDEIVVHVDVAKRGVGTASCGPDTRAEYRVSPGRWAWQWTLQPFAVS